MKKLLLSLMCVFTFACASYAGTTPINFLYIHGSDQGTEQEFDVWMKKMHKDMCKNFEKSSFIQEHLLQDAYIKKEPAMFYWADKTKEDRQLVEASLENAKRTSLYVPQVVRTLLAHIIHDAVWIRKDRNMMPILSDLNKQVLANYKKGEKTVLLGYSAGTFVTYQYLLTKLEMINLADFLQSKQSELKSTPNDIKFAKTYASQPTCVTALLESHVVVRDAEDHLILNPIEKLRLSAIKKVPAQTQISCAPAEAVSGIINFASPIIIFYSELSEQDPVQQYLTAKVLQGLMENKQFYLTVNFRKDPLGMPMTRAITYDFMKNYPITKDIKNGGGFVYDTSITGGKNVAAAHLKYWSETNRFTKAVVKAYEQGYNLCYNKTK